MRDPVRRTIALTGAALFLAFGTTAGTRPQFRFRTGVDLINVTATVTDENGHFVAGLQKADFVVFEDDQPMEITHFSAERVPVSLGIVVDTSGSMDGRKIIAARQALNRFLSTLLGPDDEVFLYRFDNAPHLVAGWTTDRRQISDELRTMPMGGATALYDAVAAALPLLESGRHRKKALLVISDGNDTSSRLDLPTVKGLIRESEALVYAIGIDVPTTLVPSSGGARDRLVRWQRGRPFPIPIPLQPRQRPPRNPPVPGVPPGTDAPRPPKTPPGDEPATGTGDRTQPVDTPVNASALHEITDDSGGRTEIVRDMRELDPATGRIGDELSRQYFLGCPSRAQLDGKWHAIRVEVRDRPFRVRARRGYVAAS
jgi:VWFA-related protein